MAGVLSYNGAHGVLELRLPYDHTGQQQVAAKGIYGYAWNSAKKLWEYPATVESARAIVATFDPDAGPGFADWYQDAKREYKAAERARALLDGTAELTGELDIQFRTEPFGHQRRYCEWAAMRDLAGVTYRYNGSAQGTGKTKCEIDMTVWELGRKICQGVPLVLCPNSVKSSWSREFLLHGPLEFFAPIILDGACEAKLAALGSANHIIRNIGLCPVIITNYDVLSQPSQKPVYDQLLTLAKQGFFGKIIFDESSMIRNAHSNRGTNAFKLAKHIGIRVNISGTPYSKRATDIFNQARVLSTSILGTSWAAFRRHHVVFGGWQNKEIVDYKNLEELREKVNRHMFRCLLEDCVDLPDEIHVVRSCDMSQQQIRATADLKKKMMAELESEDGPMVLTAPEAMVRLLRFNQISSGWLRDNSSGKLAEFKPNPKLDLLLDYLREEVSEDEKAVVWCCFRDDVERVAAACSDAGLEPVMYYGGNRRGREETEKRFLEDPNVRIMVATADAGGWGLNWQVACHCIFFSYDFDWEAMDQARARIRRVTQQRRMTYVWLVNENPVTRQKSHGVSTGVNRYILDNLAETTKMAGEMTGDTARKTEDPARMWRQAMEAL